MLESMPVALLVGSVLGILSALGIGGGSLLILWLTMVLGMEQSSARVLNLLFFLPAAVIACLFRWRQGKLSLGKVLPAIIAGPLAAVVFSFLSRSLDVTVLKKGFGILLLVTGLRELCYRTKKKPETH